MSSGTIEGIEPSRSTAPSSIQIISRQSGRARSSRPNESIWRRLGTSGHCLESSWKVAPSAPGQARPNVERGWQLPVRSVDCAVRDTCAGAQLPSMQAEKALLYADRSRTIVSLVPR
jgi:hypothetical protein